jgi:RNA polymerase sigma-70 factor (ECF subfamily)
MSQTEANASLSESERDLLERAQSGDRAAFDRLFGPTLPRLRSVVRRMVGHPDDVEDLTQQALLRAFERVETFRGDSKVSTWVCSIGSRLALDHLRGRKRWRTEAQGIFAHQALTDPDIGTAIGGAMTSPDFSYDVNEHIAYCFTCVGRSLDPEEQAAIVLRDVLEMKNEEAAHALGLSVSTFRHRLSSGRKTMTEKFEHLCALVNKKGICWQCSGLREAAAPDRRGPDVPTSLDAEGRLRIVQKTMEGSAASKVLHDVFFRFTERQEESGRGSAADATDCGKPT